MRRGDKGRLQAPFVRSLFAYQMELRRRCRVLSGGEQASDTNAVFSAMQDVLGNWVTSCVIFAVTNPPNNEENSAQLHALRYEPGITERRLRLRPRPRPQERKKDGRHFEGGFRACLRVTNVVVRHGHNITTRERDAACRFRCGGKKRETEREGQGRHPSHLYNDL